MAESNNKWLHFLLVMVVLVLVGMYFHEQIIGSVAYAVEKGVREADKEHLAKVEAISQAFRLVAKQVKPTVVHITTTAKPPERRGRRPQIDPKQIPEPFREFFEDFQDPRLLPQRPREGTGSGVIIDAEAGYIITNNHVVSDVEDGQGRIDVRLPDGRKVKADVVGRDDKTDLALLRINADKLHAITIGDSDAMEVGDWVLAIGSPFGLDQTVTQGIISAKGRSHLLEIPYEDLIQTDAAINPGNSGGPLVNLKGEVVGIATAVSSRTGGSDGVGYAISLSKETQWIIHQLVDGQEVKYGYLGVHLQDRNRPRIGGRASGRIIISSVEPESPAHRAGLQEGDAILRFDRKPVNNADEFVRLVALAGSGKAVPLSIVRDGQPLDLNVVPGLRPSPDRGVNIEPDFTWQGATFSVPNSDIRARFALPESTVGPVISAVVAGTPADKAGLRPGDVVAALNGQPVAGFRRFRRSIQSLAGTVRLTIEGKPRRELVIP